MSESQLDALLRRAAVRLRLQGALWVGLAALGAGLVCAALGVFWIRWSGHADWLAAWLAGGPILVAVIAGVGAFLLRKTELPAVAALLDRNAGTREHLVTWLHLRGRVDTLNDVGRGFSAAQSVAALRVAEGVSLAKHVPIRAPAWGRAVWLALIVLLSALLTPAGDARKFKPVNLAEVVADLRTGGEGVSKNDASNLLREMSRVQALSPAQLRKLELIATDTNLPAAAKAEALKEILNALGGVPESELTPDVRQSLDLLRKDTAAEIAVKQNGTVLTGSERESAKNAANAAVRPAEFVEFKISEQAWTAAQSQFLDIREALGRYYSNGKR